MDNSKIKSNQFEDGLFITNFSLSHSQSNNSISSFEIMGNCFVHHTSDLYSSQRQTERTNNHSSKMCCILWVFSIVTEKTTALPFITCYSKLHFHPYLPPNRDPSSLSLKLNRTSPLLSRYQSYRKYVTL